VRRARATSGGARWFTCCRSTGRFAADRCAIGKFIEGSGADYLVLTFAWGNLSAAQARRSFDLFATKIMPDFAKHPPR
jgi:hypothetical protein